MKRRCLRTGGRQKAFWGAVVSAAASLLGTGLSMAASTRNQQRAIEEQKRLQDEQIQREQTSRTANNLNNYFSTLEGDNYDDLVYRKGGRRKLRNAGIRITDGGYAIPIDYDTSLLQGNSHAEVNESGNTGIGINVGNKEIEAEGGEVIQRKGNELRVFSAQPMFGDMSPAEAVLQGADENKVFKAQEKIKKRYSLTNGKSTPIKRNRAAWGATFTTPDYIGLGTNIAGSLLSGIWGNIGYNRLLNNIDYELPEYIDETFVSGPTRWRNAAQRAEVERNRINSRRSIFRNTASSAVGLDRSQEVDTNAMYELNKLWDEKANKENEYMMRNAEMANQSRARNAAARNAYYQKVAEIKNQQNALKAGLRESRLNNNIAMIQGIGSSIGGFLQQGIDNYQADQARRMQLAASPYGTAERMAALGVDFSNPLMRSLMSDAESRLGRYDTDNTETGIKSYNDALDSYNFWNTKLGLSNTDKYNRKKFGTVNRPSLTNPYGNRRWDWFQGKFVD